MEKAKVGRDKEFQSGEFPFSLPSTWGCLSLEPVLISSVNLSVASKSNFLNKQQTWSFIHDSLLEI